MVAVGHPQYSPLYTQYHLAATNITDETEKDGRRAVNPVGCFIMPNFLYFAANPIEPDLLSNVHNQIWFMYVAAYSEEIMDMPLEMLHGINKHSVILPLQVFFLWIFSN